MQLSRYGLDRFISWHVRLYVYLHYQFFLHIMIDSKCFQAWYSLHTSPSLVREVIWAIRKTKQNCALLPSILRPHSYTVSKIVHLRWINSSVNSAGLSSVIVLLGEWRHRDTFSMEQLITIKGLQEKSRETGHRGGEGEWERDTESEKKERFRQ